MMLLLPTLSRSFSSLRSSGESDVLRMNRNGSSGLPDATDRDSREDVDRDRLVRDRLAVMDNDPDVACRWGVVGIESEESGESSIDRSAIVSESPK